MSFLFEFDAASRVLQGRLYGVVTSEELVDYYRLAVQCATMTQPRAGITDMTGITTFDVNSQTVRSIAAMQPAQLDESFLRVIVASSPEIFGMARMFESHGEATRSNLHVVKTCKEALAIVGVLDPNFELVDLDAARKWNPAT